MLPRIRRACGMFRRKSGDPSASLRSRVGWAKRSVPTILRACGMKMVGTALRAFAHPTNLAMRERASLRRQNRPLDLTETDAISVALAPAAHHERVAVF